VDKNANAAFANSTALGFGATATTANQVALGGAGSSVRVGDIAASTAEQQVSTAGLATVDANGVLGRNTTLMPSISTLQSNVGSLQTNVASLQSLTSTNAAQIDALFARSATNSATLSAVWQPLQLWLNRIFQARPGARAMPRTSHTTKARLGSPLE
jgi:ABC-type cobalamin transport system ATPase subunit